MLIFQIQNLENVLIKYIIHNIAKKLKKELTKIKSNKTSLKIELEKKTKVI